MYMDEQKFLETSWIPHNTLKPWLLKVMQKLLGFQQKLKFGKNLKIKSTFFVGIKCCDFLLMVGPGWKLLENLLHDLVFCDIGGNTLLDSSIQKNCSQHWKTAQHKSRFLSQHECNRVDKNGHNYLLEEAIIDTWQNASFKRQSLWNWGHIQCLNRITDTSHMFAQYIHLVLISCLPLHKQGQMISLAICFSMD